LQCQYFILFYFFHFLPFIRDKYIWQQAQKERREKKTDVAIVCSFRYILRKKSWLTHMRLFFFRVKLMFSHITYLNSELRLHCKYLIRKWTMTHFVGCHQWIFSNLQQNNTNSIHRGSDAESTNVSAHIMMFVAFSCKQISQTLLCRVANNSTIVNELAILQFKYWLNIQFFLS
jgi:hypothetical protein